MWFEEKYNLMHTQPDQQKRQLSATKIPITSLDKENHSAIINKYKVTLDSCTCRDYLIRELPCKHIYRLAYELGYIKPPAKINEDENYTGSHSKHTKAEITKQIKLLIDEVPVKAQLLLLGYLTKYVIYPESKIAENMLIILENKGLLIKLIPPEPTMDELCYGYSIKELKSICGTIPSKYSKRADVINYISGIPDVVNNLRQRYDEAFKNSGLQYASHYWPDEFTSVWHTVIRYLRTKNYSADDFKELRIPDDILYFTIE